MLVEPSNPFGEARNVVWVLYDQSVHSIGHNFSCTVRRGGDHRQAASHSFGGRLRKSVLKRGANVHVSSCVVPFRHPRGTGR